MKHLLFRCAEIEETVARIYRTLAERPDYSAELQKFWLEMAFDEDDHARQLKLAARLAGDKLPGEELISLERVDFLLREAKKLLARLQQGKVSLDQALRLTSLLEEHFLQVHVSAAASFTDPQTQQMFRALASGDRLHVERLQRFIAKH